MTNDEDRAAQDALATCVKDNLAPFAFSLKTEDTARAIRARLERALAGLAPVADVSAVSCRFEADCTIVEIEYVTLDGVVRTLCVGHADI